MKNLAGAFILLLVTVSVAAQSASVGDRIQLRATHPDGVPLHNQAAGTHDFQRVSDGATTTVLELADSGHWLRIRVDDGREGWIIEKYVARVVSDEPSPQPDDELLVWSSGDECRQVVNAGRRMPRDDPDSVKMGTWNVWWFPQGCRVASSCLENATEIPWLACAITWMEVDVLAVQEFVVNSTTGAGLDSLISELNSLTGGDWKTDFQDCGAASAQRVGFLWNESRLTLSEQADVWKMNDAETGPGTSDCAGNLRPGRYARAARSDAVDFHIWRQGESQRDRA